MATGVFRILLVEDNPGDVYLFRKALLSAGFVFESSFIEDCGPAMAFILAQENTSAALPRREGFDVLQTIRSRLSWSASQ